MKHLWLRLGLACLLAAIAPLCLTACGGGGGGGGRGDQAVEGGDSSSTWNEMRWNEGTWTEDDR